MAADPKLKRRIEETLRAEFQHDTVDVSDGFADNIHVVVVSRKFDGLTEREKQELLWGIIERSELDEAEKAKISLILPYSPANLK